jgi:hypothetical protein
MFFNMAWFSVTLQPREGLDCLMFEASWSRTTRHPPNPPPPPHTHSQTHTPGKTLLNEESSRRSGRYLCQHTTNITNENSRTWRYPNLRHQQLKGLKPMDRTVIETGVNYSSGFPFSSTQAAGSRPC